MKNVIYLFAITILFGFLCNENTIAQIGYIMVIDSLQSNFTDSDLMKFDKMEQLIKSADDIMYKVHKMNNEINELTNKIDSAEKRRYRRQYKKEIRKIEWVSNRR